MTGRTLRLDDEPVTVVGVMAPGYVGPRASLFGWSDLWSPLVVDEAQALAEARHGFGVVARLAPIDARRKRNSIVAMHIMHQ